MTWEKFLFYGYDRNTFRDSLDLIRWVNRRHIRIINSWFLVVNLLYLGFASLDLFGVDETFIPFYIVFTLISAVIEALLYFKRDLMRRLSMPLVYVEILVLSSFGMIFSISQPYMVATMFQVLTVLVALSFIETMVTIGGALVLSGIIFMVTSYAFKPMVIVYQDLYNTIMVLGLSLVLHYNFQNARIRQFVTYRQNIEIQHKLEEQSSFDELTNLLDRAAFFKMADALMENPEQDLLVLCLLDLDGFKEINDTYGHQVGDQAIQSAGTVILQTLDINYGEKWSYVNNVMDNKNSFAGRLGGDEFICMIRGKKDGQEAQELAEKMLANLNAVHFGEIKTLKASLGLTVITEEDRNIDGAYHRADDALYESKRAGKNRITFNNKYKRWRES